ncbi:MAG: DNA adenine methylase [Rhodospirillales bacterium]
MVEYSENAGMNVVHPLGTATDVLGDDPAYLSTQLITCIGNKRALLRPIGAGLDQARASLGQERISFLDLFSGSGIVSRYARQWCRSILANDLERYSEITNSCYLANRETVLGHHLENYLRELQDVIRENWAPGFIAELYAPRSDDRIFPGERVFYTRRNAIYLDTARQAIAMLPAPIQTYFLGPLVAQASVHTNTAGVFKGFYKNEDGIGQFGGRGRHALSRILRDIELTLPVLSDHVCPATVTRMDANELVRSTDRVDIAYVDPPYNQHPYGSNYFMLNLLCDYRRPDRISQVSGIPADWNRSRYNRRQDAGDALFDLIDACPARFVLLSYNSEGFIGRESFLANLKRFGRTRVTDVRYNTFRGSRNLGSRDMHVTEHLFLLDKR